LIVSAVCGEDEGVLLIPRDFLLSLDCFKGAATSCRARTSTFYYPLIASVVRPPRPLLIARAERALTALKGWLERHPNILTY